MATPVRRRPGSGSPAPTARSAVMKPRIVALICGVGAAGASPGVFAMPRTAFGQEQSEVRQPGAVYDFDFKGQKPAPAPRRDISGVWEPAANASAGLNATGGQQMRAGGHPANG